MNDNDVMRIEKIIKTFERFANACRQAFNEVTEEEKKYTGQDICKYFHKTKCFRDKSINKIWDCPKYFCPYFEWIEKEKKDGTRTESIEGCFCTMCTSLREKKEQEVTFNSLLWDMLGKYGDSRRYNSNARTDLRIKFKKDITALAIKKVDECCRYADETILREEAKKRLEEM